MQTKVRSRRSTHALTPTGTVTLFSEDGEAIDEPIAIRSSVAQMLAWHPSQRVLAIGFASGELITWSEGSKAASDSKPLHATPLMVLEWSPSGETLVSADYEGRIGIWKANKQGRITLLAGAHIDGCRRH